MRRSCFSSWGWGYACVTVLRDFFLRFRGGVTVLRDFFFEFGKFWDLKCTDAGEIVQIVRGVTVLRDFFSG